MVTTISLNISGMRHYDTKYIHSKLEVNQFFSWLQSWESEFCKTFEKSQFFWLEVIRQPVAFKYAVYRTFNNKRKDNRNCGVSFYLIPSKHPFNRKMTLKAVGRGI